MCREEKWKSVSDCMVKYSHLSNKDFPCQDDFSRDEPEVLNLFRCFCCISMGHSRTFEGFVNSHFWKIGSEDTVLL